MKNLQTFEEFVNESIINEGREFAPLEGDQLKFVEQINKLTFEATNKTLPKLAKQYGYEFKKLGDGDYYIRAEYEGKRMSILDFYTWTMEKFRKYQYKYKSFHVSLCHVRLIDFLCQFPMLQCFFWFQCHAVSSMQWQTDQ